MNPKWSYFYPPYRFFIDKFCICDVLSLIAVSHILFCLVSHLFTYSIPATAVRGLTEFKYFSIGMMRARKTVKLGNMLPAHLSYTESTHTKWHYLNYIQVHRSGLFFIIIFLWTKQDIALWLRNWDIGKKENFYLIFSYRKETGVISQPSPAKMLPSRDYCSI